MLDAGAQIGESVVLVEPLESGGMGSVWIGRHLSMPAVGVAVKFVLDELAADDPSVLDRFQREATVLARVKHPHVVKLFEYGELVGGVPYFVMELLKGESLAERLERTGPLRLADVGKLLDQAAGALDAIHAAGIVHRDLKCENVFLVGDPDQVCVKLIDFGLAKTPEQPGLPKLTVIGAMLGTAEYMSPEQIASARDVDHHADLWALAVLAYVATTASLPFRGDDIVEVFGAIKTGRYPPATQLRRDVPRAVDVWFARAFDDDPDGRYPDAQTMAAAWRQACEVDEAAPRDRRAFVIAAGVSTALLLLAAATVLARCG